MRVGAGLFAVLMCFVACGGTSRRHSSGSSGTSGAAGSGSGGDSVSTGGKGSKPTAAGGAGAVAAVGGTRSGSGGSDTNVGGSDANVGGLNSTGAAGGAFSKGGTTSTGESGESNGESGAPGQAGKPSVPITSCTESFPFLGTWDGNILDFYFEPQQALSLKLFENGDGEVVGTLTYGSGEPPAPPKSADEPWPPGYWPEDGVGGRGSSVPDTFSGFPYTVVRGAGCDSTLRFSIATTEAWQDWCALQTPQYTEGYGWSCILAGNGASSDGKTCTTQDNGKVLATYPVWKCTACGVFGTSLCACDESGCRASEEPTHVFDLTRATSGDMDILSGKDATCPDCTVRLERQ